MGFNLEYIYKVSNGDSEFMDELWSIVKIEWPQELDLYRSSIKECHYIEAAGVVHKLKNKFVILGASEGYELAKLHEKCLKEGSAEHHEGYNQVLIELTEFIKITKPRML